MNNSENYDIIIIGSGPAGLSVAHIANKKKLKVLLVEEGSSSSNAPPFSFSEILENYRHGGQSAIFSDRLMPIAQPMTFGGGLTINSGLFQRVSEETYKRWDISKCADWSWKKINELYDEVEAEVKISNEPENLVSDRMLRGANKLSWNYKKIPISSLENRANFRTRVVSGIYDGGGHFLSSSKASFIRKSAASLWAVGIETKSHQSTFFAKKVYVAAGAMQSVALLKRSGLVEKEIYSLKFHPVIKAVADFEGAFPNQALLSSIQIKEFQERFTLGSSVTNHAILASELSKSSKKFWQKSDLASKLIFYCQWNQCPRSFIFPARKDKYSFMFTTDWFQSKRYREGILRLNEYTLAMEAKSVLLNSQSVSSVHTFSSFPLSLENRDISLETLDVFNQKDLFVVDGSIIPDSPGVNPQETIMAFAKNIALLTL